MQRMVYAKDEDEYKELYALLQKSAVKAVVDYFTTNWHSIYTEWIMGSKWSCGNFFNSTNNRCESMNSKLKQLVERFSSLEMFVERFFALVTTQRKEKTHRAAVLQQKRTVIVGGDMASKLYARLLTPYAFDRVQVELNASVVAAEKIKDAFDSGKIFATTEDCSCAFKQAMLLPCRHIFFLREASNMPKFDKDLCAQRWSLEAYTGSCQLTQNDACDGYDEVEVSMRKDERVLSSHQKFRKGATVASKLAEVAAECSMPTFRKNLEVLETILKHWKNGCEVNVTVVRPSQQLHSPCDVEKVASTSCPAGDLHPLTEAPQTGVAVLPAPHPGSERLFCGRGLPDNSDSACPGSASSRNT
ncbi:hypothetical protein HPB48_017248 [Haemaphysalis longicornis]|uniref:SWIM-type domain-containing protein n=1 Tax=Haemaphysalis longicornis TaxID=44386 RepID=A0A9J6H403_HAELO|nr:hypothetical protein HPB48_017248 [Haemaphysalis longicornis]